ncbi:MAG: threonine-phosphate decarboxylase [Caulobacteraceae bacterium]|nr:threonine-phosphate decarboxylase [Caulobacteraceae bacterium]
MTARAQGAFGRHGGRLAAAAAAFPHAPTPWVDLSTGINPHGWRGPRAAPAALRRLPDPAGTAALERAAAAAFDLAPADAKAAAAVPGAEAALRLAPRLTGARAVAIASPTYGGHAEAWTAAGAEVRAVHPDELDRVEAEAVVVVNPNNPDGRRLPPDLLLGLARRQAERGRSLIVDESFVETAPELSVAAAAPRIPGLIVLRSFGKFFGLPGARLGFVVAAPETIARVRAAFGDWPVCADAIALGSRAYADLAWAERERSRLAAQAERLDRSLRRAGFEIVGGTSLFRLTRSRDAARRFAALAGAGVLVRPFDDRPDWLRFGPPGPPAAWRRLDAALSGFSA